MDSVVNDEVTAYKPIGVINIVIAGLFVGIFGVVLAFIYYKTRNLFAVAALHSLDDFLVFVTADAGNTKLTSFVANNGDNLASARIYLYIIFTLILVPSIVRCIRNLKSGEAIPFDEDFLPRAVEFEKKSKKRK